MSECPVCGAAVALPPQPVLNELLDCGDCSSELELMSLAPIRLSEAPLAAEDWGE